MKKITNKGFTLIELLVVVAIIAILALVVLLALNPVEMARKSRDSRRLSDMGTIRRAIDLTLADNSPVQQLHDTSTLGTGGWIDLKNTTLVTNMENITGGLDVSKYLSTFPLDPINDGSTDTTQTISASGCTAVNTVQKGQMNYQYKSDGLNYELRVPLESLGNCNAAYNDGNADQYFEIGTQPQVSW